MGRQMRGSQVSDVITHLIWRAMVPLAVLGPIIATIAAGTVGRPAALAVFLVTLLLTLSMGLTVLLQALVAMVQPRVSIGLAFGVFGLKMAIMAGLAQVPELRSSLDPHWFAASFAVGLLWLVVVHIRVVSAVKVGLEPTRTTV